MEPYFYCTYGGIRPICSDCKRNHINSPYKTSDITTWLSPSYVKIDGTTCSDYISIKESTMVNKQEFIEKAKEWLNMNIIDYIVEGSREGISLEDKKQLIEDFSKAMEE